MGMAGRRGVGPGHRPATGFRKVIGAAPATEPARRRRTDRRGRTEMRSTASAAGSPAAEMHVIPAESPIIEPSCEPSIDASVRSVPLELAHRSEERRADVLWLMTPGAPALATLEGFIRRPEWMARAACQGEPPATFFIERGGSTSRARELCSGCPVRSECLDHAMADDELAGWWGGMPERERARLRRSAR